MTAGTFHFAIEAGTTPGRTFTWFDASGTRVNLSGFTARMDIRDNNDTLLLSLTTANGRLALQTVADGDGLTQGVIAIVLTPAETTALVAVTSYKAVFYDLLLTTSGGIATRLVQGAITLSKAVSRA